MAIRVISWLCKAIFDAVQKPVQKLLKLYKRLRKTIGLYFPTLSRLYIPNCLLVLFSSYILLLRLGVLRTRVC